MSNPKFGLAATALIPIITESLKNYCLTDQGNIPEGVVDIKFGKAFRDINFMHLPKSIQKVQFSKLTRITIPDDCNGLEEYKDIRFITLDVASLDLLNYLNRFPKLKIICINGGDGRNFVIQDGIRGVIFGSTFNSNLPNTFPQSLKSVKTGIDFTKTFNLHSLPQDIEDIFIGSYRVHQTFGEFSGFKKLKKLQYFCGKPYDNLEGVVVSGALPNIDQVTLNNKFKFKNNNGTLTLEETFQFAKTNQ